MCNIRAKLNINHLQYITVEDFTATLTHLSNIFIAESGLEVIALNNSRGQIKAWKGPRLQKANIAGGEPPFNI